jgi:hypothetical protein
LPLAGYTLVTADDFDGTVQVAKGCPTVQEGGASKLAHPIDLDWIWANQISVNA